MDKTIKENMFNGEKIINRKSVTLCRKYAACFSAINEFRFANRKSVTLCRKSAFSLAELIVVFALILVVAAITIPSALYNSSVKSNGEKVKRAIETFDKFVEEIKESKSLIMVGNDGSKDTSTLVGYIAQTPNCSLGKAFFKIKNDINSSCQFQTNDGIWWNISNVKKTIISTSDDCKNYTSIPVDEKDACYNKVFYLTVEDGVAEDEGIFVVNKNNGPAKYALYFARMISGNPRMEEKGLPDYCKGSPNEDVCKLVVADKTTSVNLLCAVKKGKSKDCSISVPEDTKLYFSKTFSQASREISNQEGESNWDKAMNYCKSQNAHLATIAELQAGGYTNCWSSNLSIMGETSRDSLVNYVNYLGESKLAILNVSLNTVCVGNY